MVSGSVCSIEEAVDAGGGSWCSVSEDVCERS